MNQKYSVTGLALVFLILLNSAAADAADFHCGLNQGFGLANFEVKAPGAPLIEPSYQKFILLEREVVFSFWPAGTRANKVDFLYISIEGTQGEHIGLFYEYPVRLISAEFEAGAKDPYQNESLSCSLDPQN